MKHFFFVVVTLLVTQKVWSWGALGHRTSAQIAWSLLDQNTKNKVNEILNNQSFSEVSTWADSARAEQQWKFTVWYHFEKAPDNYTYLDNLKRQDDYYKKIGGLIEALYVAEEMLNSKTTLKQEKENALKFIIHFVSDIHQPLHTGRVEDNSGNKIPVKWLGLDMTLHQVWDSQIIYLGHKDILEGKEIESQTTNYADYLQTKFKNFKVTPELFLKYDDWMHESMVPRADAYNFKDESEEQYTNRFLDIIDLRIYLASLRIANLVTRIVNKQNQGKPLVDLKQAIIDIVGNFYEFVSLKPKPVILESK